MSTGTSCRSLGLSCYSSCVFSDLTFLQDRPTLLSSPVLIWKQGTSQLLDFLSCFSFWEGAHMEEHKDGGWKRTGITGKHHDVRVFNPNNQEQCLNQIRVMGYYSAVRGLHVVPHFLLHSCPYYSSKKTVREITVPCLEIDKAILPC